MSFETPWNGKGKLCGSCGEANLSAEMCNHVRGGKTAYEKTNGVHENRFKNRALRTAWMQDANADNKTFPRGACNGKSNRFSV